MKENGSWREIRKNVKKDWDHYKTGVLMAGGLLVFLSLVGRGICPLSGLWGLPCPGCGMTRSIFLLLTGHWKASFNMQPFAVLWVLFAAAVAVERYYFGSNRKWKKIILIILLSGMFVLYVYKMITVFPDAEPYVYLEDNLTERMAPGYGEWIRNILGNT